MLVVGLSSLSIASAHAQQVEITPLAAAGYTLSADLDLRTEGLDTLDIRHGFTWGGQIGYFFSPRWGIEALWAQQETGLRVGNGTGARDLFDMQVAQLHGNLVYQFGGSTRLQPFAFGGVGATLLRARDLHAETKLSFGVGGGIKYFPYKNVGAMGRVRYKPTRLDEASSEFCSPFGFCQNALPQVELMSGLVLRF
jgi:hypothetical protein